MPTLALGTCLSLWFPLPPASLAFCSIISMQSLGFFFLNKRGDLAKVLTFPLCILGSAMTSLRNFPWSPGSQGLLPNTFSF